MKPFQSITNPNLIGSLNTIFHLCFLLFHSNLLTQQYVSADPFYLLSNERDQLLGRVNPYSTIVRPIFIKSKKSNWSIIFHNEIYRNNGGPNQENMDLRYFGKGIGYYNSVNVAHFGKYVAFSFEPYILYNQNYSVISAPRQDGYTVLNDYQINDHSPYRLQGIKEFQLYLHYKGLGLGYGNANMWWGPGMHSSLIMSNNTTGLPYFTIGTLKELRKGIIGINIKYTLADYMNNNNKTVFFSSLLGLVTIYSNPIISIGLSRNYLSGGMDYDFKWGGADAARLLFDGLFLEDTKKDKFLWHDPWDQTIAGYFSLLFPESKLNIYLELGVDDHRANIEDFKTQPDHTIASIIGMRKYGVFNNHNLLFGFEYINLIQSRTWKFRSAAPWYNKPDFDYSSYKRRRWGAHSGSDSDDLYIIFGYLSNKFAFIPAFNYERHGVNYKQPAEIKFEWRFDTRYYYKNWTFSIYYETENAEHIGFPDDNIYAGEVTGKRKIQSLIIRTEYIIEF